MEVLLGKHGDQVVEVDVEGEVVQHLFGGVCLEKSVQKLYTHLDHFLGSLCLLLTPETLHVEVFRGGELVE